QYHDFIGFEVSQDLLDRAFRDTYGIGTDDLLKTEDLTIGSFRFGVSRVVPEMTQVALATRQHDNMPELNDQARKQFLYRLTRAGDYKLTDEAYASLVRRLAKHHFANVTPALQTNILKFFSSGPANRSLKKHKWRETQAALIALKAANLNP